MKREEGYYWVKYEGEWIIVKYYGEDVSKYPWELSRVDSEFDEIDERRIERPHNPSENPHWKKVADAIQGVFKKN